MLRNLTVPEMEAIDEAEDDGVLAVYEMIQQQMPWRIPECEASLRWEGLAKGWPTVTNHRGIQARYVAMRLDGTSHSLAEMFALQQAPAAKTDSEFNKGHCNGNQFEDTPFLGDYYGRLAEEAGVDVTGAVYKSGLARFPGDPQAWVRDRGDVARLVEARGWGCEGDVNVRAQQIEPGPDIAVADDIVEQRVMAKMDANPDLVHERRPQDVYAEAREEIKPHWAA